MPFEKGKKTAELPSGVTIAYVEAGSADGDGHNAQWGAAAALAADITAWVETGRPTADLPYVDPTDVRKVVIEKGAAKIIEKRPPESSTPPAK